GGGRARLGRTETADGLRPALSWSCPPSSLRSNCCSNKGDSSGSPGAAPPVRPNRACRIGGRRQADDLDAAAPSERSDGAAASRSSVEDGGQRAGGGRARPRRPPAVVSGEDLVLLFHRRLGEALEEFGVVLAGVRADDRGRGQVVAVAVDHAVQPDLLA